MSKFTDNIRKIARSAEIEAKIKAQADEPSRGTWEGGRGISSSDPTDTCPAYYSTRDNTYDIGDILAGAAGPKLGDKCAKLDSITGLMDFDKSEASGNIGGDVNLIIQLDGIFD